MFGRLQVLVLLRCDLCAIATADLIARELLGNLSSEKNPGWLGYIGDYTTQLLPKLSHSG